MSTNRYETKTEWVSIKLRNIISSGSVRPGERIRVLDWAKRQAVSPTPVREALEVEGYVAISSHRGPKLPSSLHANSTSLAD
jgi:DNA-binding GntR family transcriptional regulator